MAKTEGSSAGDSLTDAGSEKREGTVSGHGARYAKVYNFFGFGHAYNFPLWVMFAGGMLGFSLSRLSDLDFDHTFKVLKGVATTSYNWMD